MKTAGQILVISDTQQVSENFKKREFILQTDLDTPYPQEIAMELQGGHVDLLNEFSAGQHVSVDFSLRGRKHEKDGNARWFNTLVAFRLTKI